VVLTLAKKLKDGAASFVAIHEQTAPQGIGLPGETRDRGEHEPDKPSNGAAEAAPFSRRIYETSLSIEAERSLFRRAQARSEQS